MPRKSLKRVTDLDFVNDIIDSFTRCLHDPQFLLFLIVIIFVVYTHYEKFESSPIALKLAASTSPLAKWILTNEVKFLGGLCFLPSISAVRGNKRNLSAIVVLAFIYLTEVNKLLVYIIQSFILFFYFQLRNNKNRVTLVIMSLLLLWSGVLHHA